MKLGFAVVLVCNGHKCQHSTRSSTESLVQLDNNTINSYIAQTQLMQLTQQHLQYNRESFMCEPSNYTSSNKTSVSNNIYLSGHRPARLHTYNRDFSCGNSSIKFEGLPSNCLQCVGHGNGVFAAKLVVIIVYLEPIRICVLNITWMKSLYLLAC
jgi:hypothetical protein